MYLGRMRDESMSFIMWREEMIQGGCFVDGCPFRN